MITVHVPPGEATPVARELLAAAERLGLPPTVVATSSDGLFGFSFLVPDEVYDMAGQIRVEQFGQPEPEPESQPPKRKPGRPRKAAPPTEPEPEE